MADAITPLHQSTISDLSAIRVADLSAFLAADLSILRSIAFSTVLTSPAEAGPS
jgi:ABC-type glucose/galactose transport system permease subunit